MSLFFGSLLPFTISVRSSTPFTCGRRSSVWLRWRNSGCWANDMFNSREGKRLFGMLTAAGTRGGMAGAFGANLAVSFLFGTKQLLWLIVVLSRSLLSFK